MYKQIKWEYISKTLAQRNPTKTKKVRFIPLLNAGAVRTTRLELSTWWRKRHFECPQCNWDIVSNSKGNDARRSPGVPLLAADNLPRQWVSDGMPEKDLFKLLAQPQPLRSLTEASAFISAFNGMIQGSVKSANLITGLGKEVLVNYKLSRLLALRWGWLVHTAAACCGARLQVIDLLLRAKVGWAASTCRTCVVQDRTVCHLLNS